MNIHDIKSKIFPICQKYKIEHMYLFGSQARGNARADIPHLIKVLPTEHYKNNVPYLVPSTVPHKGATHGTLQK